jgi:hypothetical protein
MGIIELAQIQLLNETTANTPLLLENMRQVKKVIEDFSGLPTNFFVDQDDQSKLYVIGGWETVEKHSKGFSGSEGQNKILALIKDQMTITWQFYVDIDVQDVPLKPSDFVGIMLYKIKGPSQDPEERETKETMFEKMSHYKLRDSTRHAGGWVVGGMTEHGQLWVRIAAFNNEAAARAFPSCGEKFWKDSEGSYPPYVSEQLKVVKLLQL